MDTNNYYSLNISKAFATFEFIAVAFAQQLWESKDDKEKWMKDMELVLSHGNLDFIRLTFIGKDRTVIFRHQVNFKISNTLSGKWIDSVNGIELPVIPSESICGSRLTWRSCPEGHTDKDCAAYKHLFFINWTDAEPLKVPNGTQFVSEHHNKITGGRAGADIFVRSDARREGTVVGVSKRGDFAFVEDGQIKESRVFCHVRHAPKGTKFFPGQRISYILITAPRGMQARAILI